jgi:hypothetical protein
MCKLSLYKMNGYVWCKYFLCTQIIKFDWRKFKEILKYKFVIMWGRVGNITCNTRNTTIKSIHNFAPCIILVIYCSYE